MLELRLRAVTGIKHRGAWWKCKQRRMESNMGEEKKLKEKKKEKQKEEDEKCTYEEDDE
jgi:hypothetical protein